MKDAQAHFFAIGDVTTDAFIELQEAKVHCQIDTDLCTIAMRWGDKIPYKSVTVVPAVGNSANAAVAAARIGLPSTLLSYVGNDANGKECIAALEQQGVTTTHITVEDAKATNYHYVLSFNAERTILVRHEAFTYVLPELPADIDWLYLSSIGEAGEALHDDIADWLANHTEVQLVLQPGTFQIRAGLERLRTLYERTHLFVCNKSEAQRILTSDETDERKLLEQMRSCGPAIVVVTDGPSGAYALSDEGMFFVPQYPDPKPPVERTGAGDAFTATLASYLALGHTLEESLARAPINSMSVVQHIGAQKGLLSQELLEHHLTRAPKEFAVQKM